MSAAAASGVIVATVLDLGDLLRTVLASVVAGVGVTLVFSVAIWGAARSVDLSRSGRPAAAGGAAIVGGLALAATLAVVAFGIIVMTQK